MHNRARRERSYRGLRSRCFGVAASLLVMASALLPATAEAQGRVPFLAGRLKATDLRVRTQAALALGGTNDEAAVEPLCGALDDDSEVVRQAAAAALGKLKKPSAEDCLQSALGEEPNASVKTQISRALAAVRSAGGSEAASAPSNNADARFYVSISSVTNRTGRPGSDVERIVGGAIRSKLQALGKYQIAPAKETPAAAKAAIAKRKLTGYFLSVSAEAFDYSGGNLRVRVKIAVFTYPGRDMRGEVPAGLTQTGVRPGDSSAEDNLLEMAAGRAVELFAQNFH
jgi:hypothetical protein